MKGYNNIAQHAIIKCEPLATRPPFNERGLFLCVYVLARAQRCNALCVCYAQSVSIRAWCSHVKVHVWGIIWVRESVWWALLVGVSVWRRGGEASRVRCGEQGKWGKLLWSEWLSCVGREVVQRELSFIMWKWTIFIHFPLAWWGFNWGSQLINQKANHALIAVVREGCKKEGWGLSHITFCIHYKIRGSFLGDEWGMFTKHVPQALKSKMNSW